MKIEFFSALPECACEIRKKVFIDEQGFTAEFDDKDEIAVHFVMFDDGSPVAVCRLFRDSDKDFFVLGRFAVLKQYRGKKLGSALIKQAEKYAKESGAKGIIVLAQQRAADFYKKSGFQQFGAVEYEEGRPHVRMKKYL